MVEEAKKEKRRKILVTGSAGMLGTALCAEFARHHDVFALDIKKPRALGPGIRAFFECDITEREETLKAIKAANPDLIIHAAALADVDGCEINPGRARNINVNGTESVALSASELGALLIYLSTDFVFDGAKRAAYKEEDTPRPLSVYGMTKLEGERVVGKLKKYIILRTSWLFGARGKNFVDAIIEKAQDRAELKVVDDQTGSPTYAPDLAEAIRKAFEGIWDDTPGQGAGAVYHVSNKGQVTWFDYAKKITELAGLEHVVLQPITSGELARPAKRPHFSALDNGKFEKDTGVAMRPWQEALSGYIKEKKDERHRRAKT